MGRYIDADSLVEDIKRRRLIFKDTIEVHEALSAQGKAIRRAIDEAPTADVQEVVRCKDCKYSCEEKPVFGIIGYSCEILGLHCLSATDFCSYGANMDEEEQK